MKTAAQEGAARNDHLKAVSTVTERSGITYCAEAADSSGILRCQVIRQQPAYDGRVPCSISVSNETSGDAQAVAYIPELADQHYRTIFQTVIGPRSSFSTTVVLELDSGVMPEIRVALAGAALQFNLAVPNRQVEPVLRALPLADGPAAAARTNGDALPSPAATAIATYTPPQRLATVHGPFLPSRQIVRDVTPSRSSPAIAPIVLLFTALVGIVVSFVLRPQIVGIDLPRSASARSATTFSYQATGLGAATYVALGPEGQRLAEGPLKLGRGTFSVSFPSTPMPQAYLMRLRMSNLVVSSIAEYYVRVSTPAAPRPRRPRASAPIAAPQIRSLALDRAALTGGDTLNVYYDVFATAGTIALIDPASQITYGKAQLAASGHAAFVVPRVESARFFTIVVSATRGTATTQSRIGVNVMPLAVPAQIAQPVPAHTAQRAQPAQSGSTTPATQPGMPDKADDFGVGATAIGSSSMKISAPQTVRSEQTIRVVVSGAVTGTQLVLLDETGTELARRDVPAGTSSTNFVAPGVRVPSRYLFEATNPHRAGSETIVRTIAVMP